MEHVGVQVGAIGPHDRSELLVHAHLPKELRIVAEGFEHGSPQLSFEVDLAHRAVIEAEPEHKTFKWLDAEDTRCACAGSWQWLNRIQGKVRLCPRPVRLQLGAMYPGPLLDEPQRACWKLSG